MKRHKLIHLTRFPFNMSASAISFLHQFRQGFRQELFSCLLALTHLTHHAYIVITTDSEKSIMNICQFSTRESAERVVECSSSDCCWHICGRWAASQFNRMVMDILPDVLHIERAFVSWYAYRKGVRELICINKEIGRLAISISVQHL